MIAAVARPAAAFVPITAAAPVAAAAAPPPAAACGSAAARAGRGTAATAAEEAAELREQGPLQDQQRTGGEDRGKSLGIGAKLGAELAAGIAALDVAAGRPLDLLQSLCRLGELEPDLIAGELAGLARLGEGDPGADEKRLDARDGRVHRLGDLLVAHRVDLTEEQRRALGLGKIADVAEEAAELLAI